MFDLGFKQIVINADAVVTETAGASGQPQKVEIEGFGEFYTTPSGTVGFVSAAADPVAGIYTMAAPVGGAIGDVYDLKISVSGPRVLSDVMPQIDTKAFQTIAFVGTNDIGTAAAGGQIAGFNDEVLVFTGTTTLIATFQAGYEGLKIDRVVATEAVSGVSQDLAITVTAAGSEGNGLGKQVEAEVRNATWTNNDPYGVAFGGNDAVDVRAKYTEIHWESMTDDNGFEPHANLGYGDAQTVTTYGARKYVAFCNEASATAAITSISKLASDTANTA